MYVTVSEHIESRIAGRWHPIQPEIIMLTVGSCVDLMMSTEEANQMIAALQKALSRRSVSLHTTIDTIDLWTDDQLDELGLTRA